MPAHNMHARATKKWFANNKPPNVLITLSLSATVSGLLAISYSKTNLIPRYYFKPSILL